MSNSLTKSCCARNAPAKRVNSVSSLCIASISSVRFQTQKTKQEKIISGAWKLISHKGLTQKTREFSIKGRFIRLWKKKQENIGTVGRNIETEQQSERGGNEKHIGRNIRWALEWSIWPDTEKRREMRSIMRNKGTTGQRKKHWDGATFGTIHEKHSSEIECELWSRISNLILTKVTGEHEEKQREKRRNIGTSAVR